MINKKICELMCTADLRIDVCNLRLGHKKENPVNVCLRCKHSKVMYTKRGEKFKHTFESQCQSWKKQFGEYDFKVQKYTIIEHDDLFNPNVLTREEYDTFRRTMYKIEQHRVKCGKPLKVDISPKCGVKYECRS